MVSAVFPYEMWMYGAGQGRLAGDIAHVNDGFAAAFDPYSKKRIAPLGELKKFAAKEFQ